MSDFRQKYCVWPILVKIPKYEISRKPVLEFCSMRTGGRTDRQDDEANGRFSQVICEKSNFGNNGSHVETTLCEVWTIGGRGEMYNEVADCVAR
jgi:hypothetical protein